jgi:hypothetical protein
MVWMLKLKARSTVAQRVEATQRLKLVAQIETSRAHREISVAQWMVSVLRW